MFYLLRENFLTASFQVGSFFIYQLNSYFIHITTSSYPIFLVVLSLSFPHLLKFEFCEYKNCFTWSLMHPQWLLKYMEIKNCLLNNEWRLMCLGGCGKGVSRERPLGVMTGSELGRMGQSKILQGLAKLLTWVLILGEMRNHSTVLSISTEQSSLLLCFQKVNLEQRIEAIREDALEPVKKLL